MASGCYVLALSLRGSSACGRTGRSKEVGTLKHLEVRLEGSLSNIHLDCDRDGKINLSRVKPLRFGEGFVTAASINYPDCANTAVEEKIKM